MACYHKLYDIVINMILLILKEFQMASGPSAARGRVSVGAWFYVDDGRDDTTFAQIDSSDFRL